MPKGRLLAQGRGVAVRGSPRALVWGAGARPGRSLRRGRPRPRDPTARRAACRRPGAPCRTRGRGPSLRARCWGGA
ncbi:MAG: hypothetical protein EVA89_32910 [Sandaracinaceae bacterium]|nr:MAG: hypothetical protein EVA89_32910 [Sandaracinaceae bacterium]